MKTHTPGPWHVSHPTSGGGLLIKPIPGQVVAQCDELPEMEANAALIAAAPELLDVLQAIKRYGELANIGLGDTFPPGGKKPGSKDVWAFPRHMLVDLDAVIAKAKGGAA